jgi:hypothetical protein
VGTTYQSGSTGLDIEGVPGGQASVWLNRILVDSSTGNGINVNSIYYLNANWLESYGNLGNGISLSNLISSTLSNIFDSGGNGITGAAANANGFTCNTCTLVNATNIQSVFNTGQGVSILNSTDSTWSNITATNDGGWGIIESGASNRNVISSANLSSNTSGDVSIVGAQSRITNYVASGSYMPLAVNAGGTGTTTWQTGSIPFYNGSNFTENNSALFWNNANSRLGIGTTTPWANLSITSPSQQSGSLPLFGVSSTTGALLFTVLGNGNVGIGTTTPQGTLSVAGGSGALNSALALDFANGVYGIRFSRNGQATA